LNSSKFWPDIVTKIKLGIIPIPGTARECWILILEAV